MSSAKVDGRNLVLPMQTVINILDEKGCPLPLLAMKDDTIAAIFSKDDTDFQISVDNSKSDRGIAFQLTINQNSHWYSIGPRIKGEPMQALVAKGKKLHFLNQATPEGQQLVAATATKYDMKFSDAEEMCSRIQFQIKVEQVPQKTVRPPVMKHLHFHQHAMFCSSAIPSVDFTDSFSHGQGRRPVEERDVGERGVIVFGDESDQKFGSTKSVKFDESFNIKPFVIELRMQSKYSAI